MCAREAITYSRDRHIEREAVVDERTLLRDALRRSMGTATFQQVRENLDERIRAGEFVQLDRGQNGAQPMTTREMLDCEQGNIDSHEIRARKFEPLVSEQHLRELASKFTHLSSKQRQAVEDLASSRDQLMGLQGTAGAGKTTSLAAIREVAEREGYQVEGLAPTSRAAQQLEDAGIASSTLQHHLARRSSRSQGGQKHLYIVDESSLASTGR